MGLLITLGVFCLALCLMVMPWSWQSLCMRKHLLRWAAICGTVRFILGMSGGNVTTQRAFVMIAALQCGDLNRQIISFRALGWLRWLSCFAAGIGFFPGFQMSFAATIALVFVFQTWSHCVAAAAYWPVSISCFCRLSFVAGFATAPIAAIHFNQISHVGLVCKSFGGSCDVIAVVAPSAVVGNCWQPFG